MDKELERQIFEKIKYLNNLAVDKFSCIFNEFSATGIQFCVLRNITEGITMTELRKSVDCVASNMTTLIKRMERDNLVYTEKNPDDRRETKVYLTDHGKKTLNLMEPEYKSFLSELYSKLTHEEKNTLNELLTKLIDKNK
ncbi:MarR family winged helix-turn-helix transcriptional regulator [Clostridium pasteurianum]|uniref:Transcriptional regulator n=1 Tax=Clostridium pasteurianum BC1 TaxID=86416 RepID=R4K1N2_CLOPA|nr:MarR family transcriptional regulator [Clostridium pasteurianum]AGK96478.1 transcriptional regulator [Clostridium pasteurianum BC1]